MKKNRVLYMLFAMLIVFGMVMSACSPAPAEEAPVAEAPAEEAPAEEAPEVAEEEPVVEEVDVNEMYSTMLANMAGYNTIKVDGLLEELATDAPPFLLDVRSEEEVAEQGHIEGATHIPLDMLAEHTDLLPSFDTPIVAYCGSGWRATIAMTALHGMGYEDVRALKYKFADWVADGNPVADGLPEPMVLDAVEIPANLLEVNAGAAAASKDMGAHWGVLAPETLETNMVEMDDLVVIDVRRDEEVEEKGYIDAPNYIHIPLESFIDSMDMWPADTATPITIYCGSGHRSTMAMTMMLANGYESVNSLSGGYGGWASAGYPTVGGTPTLTQNYSTMLSTMEGYNTAKADALMAEMIEDTPPFILDVRTTGEVEEQGHIEGAAHIPLSELTQHIDLLPAFDTPIVVYCGSGWRATIAMTALHGMGWTDVRALKYRYADWVADGNPVADGLPEPMVLDVASVGEGLTAPVDTTVVWAKDNGWGGKDAEALNTDLIEKPDMILIDVRRAEELAEKGIIATEGQELITLPLEDFMNASMWPADKDAEIVIYCGSGHRSTMAMTILLTNGYTNVTSLKGGFGGWAEAGLPVVEYAAE